ncbi:FKBP-type peptidyl-prolyl cis-trans isomerase [Bacteroides sp. An322]|uniref:FKBP-type peptidyl-prolyl cis-trans isomerase n=1 Tax=Bacteroides sp. An322 TaxID=1965632 RepID=UPI000B387B61|nr:FKBP-type peptidyl-prolyl cis-trans isomerase [Bacteroides sp. An322]OUO15814.1 peptidylprolyl isomerase [Bacteroides sp. An322]
MKNFILCFWSMLVLMCGLVSCSEDTPVADPYANWEARNAAYIDSVANVAANPPAGETWHRYVNYKIQNDGMGTDLTLTNSDYVYVKDLTESDVELGKTPFATDTVNVHYRGWFINGEVFDQSYSGDWNVMVHEPRQFVVGEQGIRTGWTTALLHMQEGEHWEVYIPYTMGYGTSDYGDIPAYSTLVFDIRLEKVIHPKGPDDRSRKTLK